MCEEKLKLSKQNAWSKTGNSVSEKVHLNTKRNNITTKRSKEKKLK